jgi:hypothetical protein
MVRSLNSARSQLTFQPVQNGGESTAALVSAIVRFPMVATLLSNALAFDVPPALVSHRRAQPDGSYTYVL